MAGDERAGRRRPDEPGDPPRSTWSAGSAGRFAPSPPISPPGRTRMEAEDTASVSLAFESGALGSIVATTACQPGVPRRSSASTATVGHVRIVGDAAGRMGRTGRRQCPHRARGQRPRRDRARRRPGGPPPSGHVRQYRGLRRGHPDAVAQPAVTGDGRPQRRRDRDRCDLRCRDSSWPISLRRSAEVDAMKVGAAARRDHPSARHPDGRLRLTRRRGTGRPRPAHGSRPRRRRRRRHGGRLVVADLLQIDPRLAG